MAGGKVRTPHAPRNERLPNGVMRYSKAKMYRMKKLYMLKSPFKKTPKAQPVKEEQFKIKKIGGDKNGGERKVPIKRMPRTLDSENPLPEHKPKNKKPFSQHIHKLRSSLTPGTIVIVLSGRHKGKRCVFLKELKSGLMLVTGPLKLNSTPLRRMNPVYVIATKTKLDVSGVQVPDHIDDSYFRRAKRVRPGGKKDADADIFASKKEKYTVSDQRKADQKAVDEQVLAAIRKDKNDKKMIFGYLGSMWSLRRKEYPHRMAF